jgi:EamA domain-containing membrane protein RarD
LQPLLVVLLGSIYLKEKISGFDVIALILAFTASFIIIVSSGSQSETEETSSGSILGF